MMVLAQVPKWSNHFRPLGLKFLICQLKVSMIAEISSSLTILLEEFECFLLSCLRLIGREEFQRAFDSRENKTVEAFRDGSFQAKKLLGFWHIFLFTFLISIIHSTVYQDLPLFLFSLKFAFNIFAISVSTTCFFLSWLPLLCLFILLTFFPHTSQCHHTSLLLLIFFF